MVVDRLNERRWRKRRIAATAVHVLIEREAHEEHVDRRLVDLSSAQVSHSTMSVSLSIRDDHAASSVNVAECMNAGALEQHGPLTSTSGNLQ